MTMRTVHGMIHLCDYETNTNNDNAADASALPCGGVPAGTGTRVPAAFYRDRPGHRRRNSKRQLPGSRGARRIEPHEEPAGKNTIFDLASMTKPIATATSIMILRDRKAIELDDYVSIYLPAFGCNGKQDVRIEHLLTHTSGLPAYTSAAELKEQFGSPCPEKVIEKICASGRIFSLRSA